MVDLLSRDARRLAMSVITPDDRVLVLGAGGWFGRTSIDLVRGSGAALLAVASSARALTVDDFRLDTIVWDPDTVRAFAPTIVIDCAFLTHDRVKDLPLDTYVAVNRGLIDNLVDAASSPDVRTVVTISSGAAVYPRDARESPLETNPYGYLKRESEDALRRVADVSGVAAVIARAWSVSGAYPRNPRAYALGDMIAQARAGGIHISAQTEVWRRYATADELVAVSLALATPGTTVVDSGGPLVEMADLAESVRATINPAATITRGTIGGVPNRYHSDGADWARACRTVGLAALSLPDQIGVTARGMTDTFA